MFEVILDLKKSVVDSTILALVKSGYAVYVSDKHSEHGMVSIAFTVEDDDVTKINYIRKEV